MIEPARFMLDTNIVSDLIRHPNGMVTKHIRDIGEQNLVVSIITAAELRFGAVKRGSRALANRVHTILETFPIVPFDLPADAVYADIRSDLEAHGRMIGANDLLIAAHALSLGLTIVTANVSEFARVRGLACENWLT